MGWGQKETELEKKKLVASIEDSENATGDSGFLASLEWPSASIVTLQVAELSGCHLPWVGMCPVGPTTSGHLSTYCRAMAVLGVTSA